MHILHMVLPVEHVERSEMIWVSEQQLPYEDDDAKMML